MAQSTDDRRLTQLRCRDPHGFDRAYAAYATRMHSFLLSLSGCRDLADDLLPRVFMRLVEGMEPSEVAHMLSLDAATR